jgi:hypothetical protein
MWSFEVRMGVMRRRKEFVVWLVKYGMQLDEVRAGSMPLMSVLDNDFIFCRNNSKS